MPAEFWVNGSLNEDRQQEWNRQQDGAAAGQEHRAQKAGGTFRGLEEKGVSGALWT